MIDDVGKYGGNSYVCIKSYIAANENLFYTSYGTYANCWSLQGESLFLKDTYANSTWYKLNDLVNTVKDYIVVQLLHIIINSFEHIKI